MGLINNKRNMALSACRLLQAHRWWGLLDRWHGLVVLNYHRIGDPAQTLLDPGVFSATTEQFESQLRCLKADCDVIRVADIADVLRSESKRRSVLIGTVGTLIGYALLPWLNSSLVVAVAGIAFTRGCFEFGIVSQISLLSEQVPDQRGKMMSLGSAIVMIAGAVATITGPWLYVYYGVWGLCITSVVALLLSLAVLIGLVSEPQ